MAEQHLRIAVGYSADRVRRALDRIASAAAGLARRAPFGIIKEHL